MVNLAGGHGGVAEVFRVAVGRVEAAGGGNAIGRVIGAVEPAGVVVDTAAAQLASQREETGGETDDATEKKSRSVYFFHQFLNLLFS